jgi:outer membrane protein TolC
MKYILLIAVLHLAYSGLAQSVSRMPDSVRRMVDEQNGVQRNLPRQFTTAVAEVNADDVIKNKLVKLALKNADLSIEDANIEIAEIGRRKANTSMLSSVSIGGNINEFVINNSAAANFFPKYNAGIAIPLDIFAKTKAEKRTADQMINIGEARKQQRIKTIRTNVLVLYEIYKEKSQQVQLQKISMESDLEAYDKGQKDFVTGDGITLSELNNLYKVTIMEKAVLATKEKEFNIAVIELEEMIGTSLDKVL